MASPEEIAKQQRALRQYRDNLATLLEQARHHGGQATLPLAQINTIRETRREIGRIKAVLRSYQVTVEDLPDDEVPPADGPAAGAPAPLAAGPTIDQRQGTFVSGTTYGAVIGTSLGPVYNIISPGAAGPGETLQARLRDLIAQRRAGGDEDSADDLEQALRAVQSALKARQEGKAERQRAKLDEARQTLGRLAAHTQALLPLLDQLDR